MCLPPKSDQPSSTSAGETRAFVGIGALMMLACLAGPAVGALGVGVLAGVGGAVVALALCFAVPAGALAWRGRSARAREADDLSARA